MERRPDNDRFARESFGMRRMAPWQVTAMTIVVLALLAFIIFYAMGWSL